MNNEIQTLLAKWQNRYSWMLTYAEEAFYAGDMKKANHFEICARQWQNAIADLEMVLDVEERK